MKDTNNKSRRTKKYRYTAAEVAEIVGCSESYVNQVRQGVKAISTPKAKQIQYVDEVLSHNSNALIEEVQRIVKV